VSFSSGVMPLPLSFVNKITHHVTSMMLSFSFIADFIQESHLNINPCGIVAIGPDVDFNKPHDRATRFA